jgi:hypothetical protein
MHAEARPVTPFQILASAFAISSFAGLAALLRSKQELTVRSVASAVTYSGAMGLIIGMLWMNQYGTTGNPYFLVGVAGLAGIGGVTVIDLALMAAKKSGITLQFSRPDDKEPPGAQ